MPYAHRPLILDADTHMMEHADWLPAFADPDIRPRLVPFAGKDARVRALAADAVARAEARRGDATLRAEAEADFMSMKFKGWHGLGAFDGAWAKTVFPEIRRLEKPGFRISGRGPPPPRRRGRGPGR